MEERYKGQVDPVVIGELGQKLYSELKDRYGINAPVDFIIGKGDEDKDVIYAIVDKIDGTDLDKIEVTPELTEEVEKLYASIAQYYLDKLPEEGGLYLADINSASQYVYGKKKGDEVPHIYLVDTDFYIRDGKVALCNVVLWLYRHMVSVERKYGKEFTRAREIIQQILDTPLPQNITTEQKSAAEEIISKTKGYLRGSLPIDDNDAHPIFSDLE